MNEKERHEETKTAIFKTMQLQDIFERTLNNCKHYEREEMPASLNNEIGVLRGVAYCLECFGVCVHTSDFIHFIQIQQEATKQEKDAFIQRIIREQQANH